MRKPNHTLLLLALASPLLWSCATASRGDDPFQERAQSGQVRVSINNLAFSDVTVWGVTNGSRRRLGNITGKREADFTLPVSYASELYLEIDLLAGPRCRTETMLVQPGDHVELTVRGDAANLACGVP